MFREDVHPTNHFRNVILCGSISGSCAGLVCDTLLFPLDTLKTRLQSQHGFMQSGGFKQVYQGILPVIIGAAPSASLFFISYEGVKELLQPYVPFEYHWMVHMGAAAAGEVTASLARVPAEVIKQRKQALLGDTIRSLGLKNLYRGYGSTVLRDMPFGVMQMPLWEFFKLQYKQHIHRECTPLESAGCAGVAAAISTTLATPLDVTKTRIMLASTSASKDEVKIVSIFRQIYRENGIKGFFAGYCPRVCCYTIGGVLYFGIYEQVRQFCLTIFPYTSSSR